MLYFQSEESKLIEDLKKVQSTSTTFKEWEKASEQLDILLGNDKWKKEEKSDIYDYELVKFRTTELARCRKSGDLRQLLFMIRTQLERNLGNMGDIRLYKASQMGTKKIIEDYISECELCLKTILEEANIESLSENLILDTIIQTRKAFGRTALVLSGGSMLGLIHIGVMRELLHANLLPRIVSGSSAGSIFASVLCIHFDSEIDALFEALIEEKFDVFEEAGNEESFFVRLARFLKFGTVLDNKYLAGTLQTLLGNITFQEAYNRTRRILNVTVSPESIYESARILNYLTSPNVLIWSAVCASCSVPFVFPSLTLLAKDTATGKINPWSPSPIKFIDGSVANDLPLSRLSELFNVNHFIACQVNPHVVPFVKVASATSSLAEKFGFGNVFGNTTVDLNASQNIFIEEISHYLFISHELGAFKNLASKLRSLILQKYTGDITIVPDFQLSELKSLFKNPTKELIQKSHLRGQKTVWPHMALIRNHCAIELALDKAIHTLRSRVISKNSQALVLSKNSNECQIGRKLHYSATNLRIINSTHSFQRSAKSIKPDGFKHHARRKTEGFNYLNFPGDASRVPDKVSTIETK